MKYSSTAIGTIAALAMTPMVAWGQPIGQGKPRLAAGIIADSHGAVVGRWYPAQTANLLPLDYVLLYLSNNPVVTQVNATSFKGGADNLYFASSCSGAAYIAQVNQGDEFYQSPLAVSSQETFSRLDPETGFGASPLYYADLAAGAKIVTVCAAENTAGDCNPISDSPGGCTSITAYPALSYDWSHLAMPLRLQ